MDELDLRLDGNALAGLLGEALKADVTGAIRRCQSCGAVNAIGAHLAYRGAGIVLRCPSCEHVALVIAELPDRYVIVIAGTVTLEAPR